MPRKKRPLDRDGDALRDARLVVIASEDTLAVRDYFSRFRLRRVQFRILPTEGGRSAPQHVIDRLDAERRSVDYDEGDEFWVCLDADHWMEPSHIGNLREVIRLCNQKQYRLAICNPCFELWLLLHFEDHTGQELRNCASVVEALRIVANGYQKGAVTRLPITAELVHLARERARRLDNDNRDPPTGPAARIHRILDSLLERDSIDLKS
jgi:hypothetical protein